MKALLSIHPRFSEAILSGLKRYEYRRRVPLRHITHVVIYETSPTSMVVGEARVTGILSGPKEHVWRATKEAGFLSHEEFSRYFSSTENASAIALCEAIRYDQPIPIQDLALARPPQSFCYIGGNR